MLAETYREKIRQTLQSVPGICSAILYGSSAQDEHFRDVDIALFVDRGQVGVDADFEFCFRLERRLRKALHLPVDVRIINEASLSFRYNVSKGAPLLINDEELYAQFLESTWDRYLDFEPVALDYIRQML
jgi:uncharacterized protein